MSGGWVEDGKFFPYAIGADVQDASAPVCPCHNLADCDEQPCPCSPDCAPSGCAYGEDGPDD